MSKFGRRRSRQSDNDRQMSQYEREEVSEEVDEYDDEYDEDMIELDPVEVDRLMTRLEQEQNFPMAIVGSLVGALVAERKEENQQ